MGLRDASASKKFTSLWAPSVIELRKVEISESAQIHISKNENRQDFDLSQNELCAYFDRRNCNLIWNWKLVQAFVEFLIHVFSSQCWTNPSILDKSVWVKKVRFNRPSRELIMPHGNASSCRDDCQRCQFRFSFHNYQWDRLWLLYMVPMKIGLFLRRYFKQTWVWSK